MSKEIPHFVNGQQIGGRGTRTAPVFNPATGEQSASVRLGDASDVDAAVQAGLKAFPAWSETPPLRRARILNRFLAIVEAHIDELAAVITAEHGKVLSDAKGEVHARPRGRRVRLRHPAAAQGRVHRAGRHAASTAYSLRQPLGVVAGITPFNFPAMVPMWMFPVAIACGNTFILKPSRARPVRVAAARANCSRKRACPRACSTSSTATRRRSTRCSSIRTSRRSASSARRRSRATSIRRGDAHGKRVQALGGAKNHMIVMPDADIDQAVDALMGAAYGSAGERCMAISVAVPVGEQTADTLIDEARAENPRAECRPGHGSESRDGAAGHRRSIATR